VIQIARLSAALVAEASCRWTLSVNGRLVLILSRSDELATAACRSLTMWQTSGLEDRARADDKCVVATFSQAGVRFDGAMSPERRYHHPGMGTFLGYELDDGWAVVQPGHFPSKRHR